MSGVARGLLDEMEQYPPNRAVFGIWKPRRIGKANTSTEVFDTVHHVIRMCAHRFVVLEDSGQGLIVSEEKGRLVVLE